MLARNLDELTSAIEALRARDGADLFAMEGASQSGKTRWAGRLAARLNGVAVSTDNFRREGVRGSRYQEGLELRPLRWAIESALAPERTSLVIVEGICVRETFGRLDLTPKAVVYCKKLSAAGVWNGDPELNRGLDPDSKYTQEVIDWWWFDYHERVDPLGRADVVLEWRED